MDDRVRRYLDGELTDAELTAEEREVAREFAAPAAGRWRWLLESKVAEGRAKGVATATIEAAIERRTEALMAASDAFAEAGWSTRARPTSPWPPTHWRVG